MYTHLHAGSYPGTAVQQEFSIRILASHRTLFLPVMTEASYRALATDLKILPGIVRVVFVLQGHQPRLWRLSYARPFFACLPNLSCISFQCENYPTDLVHLPRYVPACRKLCLPYPCKTPILDMLGKLPLEVLTLNIMPNAKSFQALRAVLPRLPLTRLSVYRKMRPEYLVALFSDLTLPALRYIYLHPMNWSQYRTEEAERAFRVLFKALPSLEYFEIPRLSAVGKERLFQHISETSLKYIRLDKIYESKAARSLLNGSMYPLANLYRLASPRKPLHPRFALLFASLPYITKNLVELQNPRTLQADVGREARYLAITPKALEPFQTGMRLFMDMQWGGMNLPPELLVPILEQALELPQGCLHAIHRKRQMFVEQWNAESRNRTKSRDEVT